MNGGLGVGGRCTTITIYTLLTVAAIYDVCGNAISLCDSLFKGDVFLCVTRGTLNAITLVVLYGCLLAGDTPLRCLNECAVVLFTARRPVGEILLGLARVVAAGLNGPLSVSFLRNGFFADLVVLLTIVLVRLVIVRVFEFVGSGAGSGKTFEVLFTFIRRWRRLGAFQCFKNCVLGVGIFLGALMGDNGILVGRFIF